VPVDAVRQAAGVRKPASCPIGFDLPSALKAGDVDKPAKLDSAEAEASKTETAAIALLALHS
jgi:hypothetical protein